MEQESGRRGFLTALGSGSIAAIAGCVGEDDNSDDTLYITPEGDDGGGTTSGATGDSNGEESTDEDEYSARPYEGVLKPEYVGEEHLDTIEDLGRFLIHFEAYQESDESGTFAGTAHFDLDNDLAFVEVLDNGDDGESSRVREIYRNGDEILARTDTDGSVQYSVGEDLSHSISTELTHSDEARQMLAPIILPGPIDDLETFLDSIDHVYRETRERSGGRVSHEYGTDTLAHFDSEVVDEIGEVTDLDSRALIDRKGYVKGFELEYTDSEGDRLLFSSGAQDRDDESYSDNVDLSEIEEPNWAETARSFD